MATRWCSQEISLSTRQTPDKMPTYPTSPLVPAQQRSSLSINWTRVVPENSIRYDSRCEGESDHHPMRCLRSSTCLEHLSPICSSRGVGLKLRTCPSLQKNPASLRPDVRFANDAPVVAVLFAKECGEICAAPAGRRKPLRGKLRLDLGRPQRGGEPAGRLRQRFLRRFSP